MAKAFSDLARTVRRYVSKENSKPQPEGSIQPSTSRDDIGQQICAICKSRYGQPQNDVRSTRVSFSNLEKQPFAVVAENASLGCPLCKLIITTLETSKFKHRYNTDPSGFLRLSLDWRVIDNSFGGLNIIPSNPRNMLISTETAVIRFIRENDPENKTRRELIASNTGSDLCTTQAMQWFKNCNMFHDKCHQNPNKKDWLPTRLIDLGSLEDPCRPRLLITAKGCEGVEKRYVTLSHRWTTADSVKLESSNLETLLKSVPIELLPKTFQEAMEVTRKLGIRYLWIDSLCILQDSAQDWEFESILMGDIYGNSVCNIAATGASDYGGGLFQEREVNFMNPQKLHIHFQDHDQTYLAAPIDSWARNISLSCLNSRGWVLQERLLSPRTLHFASQLFWECKTLQASEMYPGGLPQADTHIRDLYHKFHRTMKSMPSESDAVEFWRNLVDNYVGCELTEPTDRLIAISGIAKSLEARMNDEYLAGLWRKDLPYSLAWYFVSVEGEIQHPETYRCPSWSWAALNYNAAKLTYGTVFTSSQREPLMRLLATGVQPVNTDPFGLLQGGFLQMSGRVERTGSLLKFGPDGTFLKASTRNGGGGYHQLFGWLWVDVSISHQEADSMYCLPLFVWGLDGLFDRSTACLLLKRCNPDRHEFTRAGVLHVYLDRPELIPEEVRWVAEYTNCAPELRDDIPITLL